MHKRHFNILRPEKIPTLVEAESKKHKINDSPDLKSEPGGGKKTGISIGDVCLGDYVDRNDIGSHINCNHDQKSDNVDNLQSHFCRNNNSPY